MRTDFAILDGVRETSDDSAEDEEIDDEVRDDTNRRVAEEIIEVTRVMEHSKSHPRMLKSAQASERTERQTSRYCRVAYEN